MSRRQRQDFTIDDSLWQGDASIRDRIVDLLRDWGTGLELPLYHAAIVHLLGDKEKVSVMLPLYRDGIPLGNQRFHLMEPDSAFRITAFNNDADPYASQLRRLLLHSPLQSMHWINISLDHISFVTVQRQ